MDQKQSLDRFISCLARKIAIVYPSNCADEEDYAQIGHMTLAEIEKDEHKHRNFRAYAIVAVANTMRNAALDAMCAASAPRRIKKRVHKVEMFLAAGYTEQKICGELKITTRTLIKLRSLINAKSWHMLFKEPTCDSIPFSICEDLLSSSDLTEEDRTFIRAQLNGTVENLGLSRKQRYSKAKGIRPKLVRSGYGI